MHTCALYTQCHQPGGTYTMSPSFCASTSTFVSPSSCCSASICSRLSWPRTPSLMRCVGGEREQGADEWHEMGPIHDPPPRCQPPWHPRHPMQPQHNPAASYQAPTKHALLPLLRHTLSPGSPSGTRQRPGAGQPWRSGESTTTPPACSRRPPSAAARNRKCLNYGRGGATRGAAR